MKKLVLSALILCGACFADSGYMNGRPVIFTFSSASVGSATDTTILAANQQRSYLLVQNESANPCYLGIGFTQTALNYGVSLTAGSSYDPKVIPSGSVHIYCPSGAANQFAIIEGK